MLATEYAEYYGIETQRENKGDEETMNVTYELKGNAVVIKDGFSDPIVLNLESVKTAIETIKAQRLTYATTRAYRRHLFKYEGALAFLEAKST